MLQALSIYFATDQRCPKATGPWVLGCSQQLRSMHCTKHTCCCYHLPSLLLCCCIAMCCSVGHLLQPALLRRSMSCLQSDLNSCAATYKRVKIFGEGAAGAHTWRVELWGCGVLQRKMLTPQTRAPPGHSGLHLLLGDIMGR